MGSEDVDDTVEKLLNGEGLEVTDYDWEPEELRPATLKKNVCYIVSAIIFNAKEEVLMVQEAKRECHGLWYLPAGRMEKGESIQEAVQREVKEEAGVDCQPVTMLLVEEQGPRWIRLTFLAEVTGGSLKTTAEADAESLQAQWWDRESPLPLRARDVLPLIDAGLKYHQKPRFPACQPVDLPCEVVCQRLLLAFTITDPNSSDEERVWLLVGNCTVDAGAEMRPRFPVAVATHTVIWTARKLIYKCMASSYQAIDLKVCGILGVQHNGRIPGKTDGLCFNTLMTVEYLEEGPIDPCSPPPLDSESYRWHEVTNQVLRANILQRIKEASLVPVHSRY